MAQGHAGTTVHYKGDKRTKTGAYKGYRALLKRESTALLNELNYEFQLLADIQAMRSKATQTKRELLAKANAHFIH